MRVVRDVRNFGQFSKGVMTCDIYGFEAPQRVKIDLDRDGTPYRAAAFGRKPMRVV